LDDSTVVWLVGIFLTIGGLVFGWFLLTISQRITDQATKSSQALAAILDRMATERTELIDLIGQNRVTAKNSTSAVAARLTDRIKDVEKGVVYKDYFGQYKETQDARYDAVVKMQDLLKEQMKALSTANTTEHNRICGKLDSIPGMLQEEIRNTFKLLNGET